MNFQNRFLCTVSSEFVASLSSCRPRHLAASSDPKLATFFIGGPSEKMAIRVKVKDRKVPVVGEWYHAVIHYRRSVNFTDQEGIRCRTRDMWEVRLYPHQAREREYPLQGELRFEVFPKGCAPSISPEPQLFCRIVEGQAQRGILYLAEPGKEYQVSSSGSVQEELFAGLAIVDLGEPEEFSRVPEGIVREHNAFQIYDRRHNSSVVGVGLVRHIRRTYSDTGRTAEFWAVYDTPRGTGQIDPEQGIHHVLTPEGLFPWSPDRTGTEDEGQDPFGDYLEDLQEKFSQ